MTLSGRKVHPTSRVQELATYLRELALTKGPEAKLPTARELGSMFGMSTNTVNVTLDLLEEQHVISRRQGSGIYVSPKIYRKSVCVLFFSDFFRNGGSSPFWGILWSLFAEEMERRMASHGMYMSFHLVIQTKHDASDLPEDVVMMIQRGNVHAVMAVGINEPIWIWLQQQGIPVVGYAGPGDYLVGASMEQQVHLAVSQLVEQGCRSIGLWIALDPNQPDLMDTYVKGFRSALQAYGAEFVPELVRDVPFFPENGVSLSEQERGYRMAQEVFGASDGLKPDGLFITVDMITAGALVAFQKLQIVLGRDLKVATHANKGSPILFGGGNDLILVETNPAEIVQAMFALMDAVLAGKVPSPYKTIESYVHIKR